MKIQKLTVENRPKVYALLQCAFPESTYRAGLVKNLHDHDRPLSEWICIHTNKVIAYIAFANAYHGKEVCGLHLATLAVSPDFATLDAGSELLRFALRQTEIKNQPLFVMGEPGYYSRFGFEPCRLPICPFGRNNANFLGQHNTIDSFFTVGYEPEFTPPPVPPAAPQAGKRHKRQQKG